MTPAFPQFNSPLVTIQGDQDGGIPTGTLTPQWLTFFQWLWSLRIIISTGIIAAGTGDNDATPVGAGWCQVTTVASGTGIIMDQTGAGDTLYVINAGANALKIYPPPNAQIDALGVTNGYSLAPGKTQIFRQLTDRQVYSQQLG